jgi:hypothetical protein
MLVDIAFEHGRCRFQHVSARRDLSALRRRDRHHRARRPVGLGVFLGFAMPLWQPGQPLVLTIVIGVGGGLLMAATGSLITGVTLRRVLR